MLPSCWQAEGKGEMNGRALAVGMIRGRAIGAVGDRGNRDKVSRLETDIKR
jgi:hypothetical protein